MRDDIEHEFCPIRRHWHETQNGVQTSGNDHQCWRFDTHGDTVGVGRSMFRSKGISDVSSMVTESENDQRSEYDIDESGEWNEHSVGVCKLADERHFFDWPHETAYSRCLWAIYMGGSRNRSWPTKRSDWNEWKEDNYHNPGTSGNALIQDKTAPYL